MFLKLESLPESDLKLIQVKLDVIKTIFGAFALVSVVGAGIGLWFQWHTLEENQTRAQTEVERRKKEYAQSIISGWDENTSDAKNEIEGLLRRLTKPRVPNPPEMDRSTAIRIWVAKDNKTDDWKIRKNTTSLLNYFESVANAYLAETGNPELLKSSLNGPMMDWRDHLRYYTALADCVRGRDVWKPYYTVADAWIVAEQKNSRTGRFSAYVPSVSPTCSGTKPEKIESCCEAALMKMK